MNLILKINDILTLTSIMLLLNLRASKLLKHVHGKYINITHSHLPNRSYKAQFTMSVSNNSVDVLEAECEKYIVN